MSMEEKFTDVDGTSPSSMKGSENENLHFDEDLVKGGTVNESIVNTPIEIASADHHQESLNLSSCRICHSFRVNEEITEIIDLGCDCKLGLSHAHKACAEKWFEQKGHRVCEVCKQPAKNIPTPVPISRDPVWWHTDVEWVGNGSWLRSDIDWVGNIFWLRRRLTALALCWVATGIYMYKVRPGFFESKVTLAAVLFSDFVLIMPVIVNVVIYFRRLANRHRQESQQDIANSAGQDIANSDGQDVANSDGQDIVSEHAT